MLRTGLTGGVGSGKSAALDMLRALGAPVSQSDEVGRELMQPGHDVFDRIVAHFGAHVLSADGTLNRTLLARIAFAEGRVEELNAIVHPAVIAAQTAWFDRVAAADPAAVAVVESALIFETKHGRTEKKHGGGQNAGRPWRTRFDCIVVVTAPIELRRDRYMRRISGSDSTMPANREATDRIEAKAAADFDRRASAQWTDEQKVRAADYVLRNDGTLADLERQVSQLYQTLRQRSVDQAARAAAGQPG